VGNHGAFFISETVVTGYNGPERGLFIPFSGQFAAKADDWQY